MEGVAQSLYFEQHKRLIHMEQPQRQKCLLQQTTIHNRQTHIITTRNTQIRHNKKQIHNTSTHVSLRHKTSGLTVTCQAQPKKDIHNITPRGVFFEAIEGGVIVSGVSRFHTLFTNLKKIKKNKKAEQSFDHPAFFKNLLFYFFIWNIFVHYGFLRGLL